MHSLAQVLALGLVLDALRDADVRILRQVHQEPSRDRHLGGEPRTLAADGILDDLDQQRLAFGEDLLDRLRFAGGAVARRPDVRDVEERRAREAHLDERRLHAGQYAAHTAEIDVAHEPAARAALDVKLLDGTLLGHRHPRLLRGDVDQDLLIHRSRLGYRDSEPREQGGGFEQRESHRAGIAALDPFDEGGGTALDGIRARLVERLARLDVGGGAHRRDGHEPHTRVTLY